MPALLHLLLLALLLLPAGCGPAAAPPADTLIYGRGGDADQLDPIHTDVGETVKVLVNLYDTLVAYHDRTLEIVPALATSWESSDDGLRWTFHLREGVQFHDGTEVDADAVAFSFARLIEVDHPHVHSNIVPFRPSFEVIDRIETPDPRTVVFHLKHPDAVFLQNLCMYAASIVSPAAVKRLGRDFATRPVGSGPFRLQRWARDQELVLEAFPEHWRGPPGVSRVVFLPVSESAVRVKQLQRGEIHIADNLRPADLDALEKEPGIVLQQQPGVNVGYLTMNTERPPLDDPRVRRAIWHAVDKPRLIRQCYAGHARPAVNMLPPTIDWAYNDEIVDRAYDPERSRELLAEAAADGGFELPLRLELHVMDRERPYMQQPAETAVFLKDALRQVGIDVSIVTNPINQHFQRLSRGEHDLGLSGWSSDNNDADNFLYQLLHSENVHDAGNNLSRYRNPELDELLTAAKRETDRAERARMYRRGQQLVFEDAPTVPLVHTKVRIAQRSDVQDYFLHPGSLVRLRTARLGPGKPATGGRAPVQADEAPP